MMVMLGLTRPCLMKMISPPPRVKKLAPLVSQTCDHCFFAPLRGRLALKIERQVSHLEELFEDHSVVWFAVPSSLDVEHTVRMQRGSAERSTNVGTGKQHTTRGPAQHTLAKSIALPMVPVLQLIDLAQS